MKYQAVKPALRLVLLATVLAVASAFLGESATRIDAYIVHPNYPLGIWSGTCDGNCPFSDLEYLTNASGTAQGLDYTLVDPPAEFTQVSQPDGSILITVTEDIVLVPGTDVTPPVIFPYRYENDARMYWPSVPEPGGASKGSVCMAGTWTDNLLRGGAIARLYTDPNVRPLSTACPEDDLSVTVTADRANAYVGDVITFRVVVSNNGPDESGGLGFYLSGYSVPDTGTNVCGVIYYCLSSPGLFTTTCGTRTLPSLGWTSSVSIRPGDSYSCQFQMIAAGALIDPYPSGDPFYAPIALALQVTSGAFELDRRNNVDIAAVNVYQADLQLLSASASAAEVVSLDDLRDGLTYTFQMKNNGPAKTTASLQFVVRPRLPLEHDDCGGSISPGPGPFERWRSGEFSLGPGQTRTCAVTFRVDLTTVERPPLITAAGFGSAPSAFSLRTVDPIPDNNTFDPITVRVATRLDYYGLGDSVAAGHGLPDGGQAADCSQSTRAYPYKVAAALGDLYSKQRLLSQDPNTASVHDLFYEPEKFETQSGPHHHLACNGASSYVILPLFDPVDLPEQVSQLLAALPRDFPTSQATLVSITIGANDFDFVNQSILGTHLCASNADFAEWVNGTSNALRANVAGQLARLLDANPNIHVVLTDYFNPYNQKSGYFSLMRTVNLGIPLLRCVQLSDAQLYARTVQIVRALNQAIADAASANDPSGSRVRVTSTIYDSFKGRESAMPNCGSANLNGTLGSDDIPDKDQTFIQYPDFNIRNVRADVQHLSDLLKGNDCFHPNQAGADSIALAVEDAASLVLPAQPVATPLP